MNRKTKLLFCDDDKNICELARLYLEKEGYEIAFANDGKSDLRPGRILDPGEVGWNFYGPEMMPQLKS